MKKLIPWLSLFCLVVNMELIAQERVSLFDSGWKFHRGGAQGAEQPGFDDSSWRNLDLPHDWSIEDLAGNQFTF